MNEQIDIQLTEEDIAIIKDCVKDIQPPNCYLEVGVYQGGSASVTLESAQPNIELYGVDIMDNFKLKDTRFNFINKASLDVAKYWNKSIGVLFIDGNHDCAGEDFLAWEKFVVKGGYILFHDFALHSPLVIKQCDELVRSNKNYKVLFTPKLIKNHGDSNTSIFKVIKL